MFFTPPWKLVSEYPLIPIFITAVADIPAKQFEHVTELPPLLYKVYCDFPFEQSSVLNPNQ